MHEPLLDQHLIAASAGLQAAGMLHAHVRMQIASGTQAAFLSNYFAGLDTERMVDEELAAGIALASVVHADALLAALKKERKTPRPF